MNDSPVHVIGAGLAGVEAAHQLAHKGIPVYLHEMKKIRKSPAHQSESFAELVCSNSFRSDSIDNAVGLLKEELRLCGSLVMQAADATRVPAGSALAVDRSAFSEWLTRAIRSNPLIQVIDEEVTAIPDGFVILATGPLTSDALFAALRQKTGIDTLYFFDAAAPIVEADSIDTTIAYRKSRYDKGEATYLNCPMTKAEYDAWYEELIRAECVIPKEYELKVFEGCMPFEEMARRGKETLLYGPMKPVGLEKPDGSRPYAVVQLRQDNLSASMYNLVGFQTHLTFPEQRRILRMIPGLQNAEIIRYGVMHKNTFLNAPLILNEQYQMKNDFRVFVAGQLSGVEGYVESVGSGMVAALNMANLVRKMPLVTFPTVTALGAHAHYLAHTEPAFFQPMNINHGIFPPIPGKHQKRTRKSLFAERSLAALRSLLEAHPFD
ncbi:MAG TPA: methylenetetrahydrofolate--tRNA-(uracil(54)-C(5))-methyltransferase (FADH(2)-oxidizing) TrmFO [Candidatus Izemoplasmatales bacterium]|nr:methylenetetrahydrofolate--tRNA-(uracil(54)-C(5))-methyltransferase (FADH(2)-oxidizing) TrmFO [Candidatus Izemoplasmatales bacterium]